MQWGERAVASQEADKEGDQPEMEVEAARKFRMATARLNCLAQDRPDAASMSCVLARSMSKP